MQTNANAPRPALRFVNVPADMSAADRSAIKEALYRGAQHVIVLHGEEHIVWHDHEARNKNEPVQFTPPENWVVVRASLCDDYKPSAEDIQALAAMAADSWAMLPRSICVEVHEPRK